MRGRPLGVRGGEGVVGRGGELYAQIATFRGHLDCQVCGLKSFIYFVRIVFLLHDNASTMGRWPSGYGATFRFEQLRLFTNDP